MPFRFFVRQSLILAKARWTAIFIQANSHASTISWGSRASKAFYNCKQIDWLINFSLFVCFFISYYSFSIYAMTKMTDFFPTWFSIHRVKMVTISSFSISLRKRIFTLTRSNAAGITNSCHNFNNAFPPFA